MFLSIFSGFAENFNKILEVPCQAVRIIAPEQGDQSAVRVYISHGSRLCFQIVLHPSC